jgi:hypothetical protein
MALNLTELMAASYEPSTSLFALLIAPRGGGKSYSSVTTGGRVLQLAFLEEDHAIPTARVAAVASDSKLTSILINQVKGKDGKDVILKLDNSQDVAKLYQRLLDILDTPGLAGQFDTVVLDGLSALDLYVAKHPEVLALGDNSYGKDSKKMVDLHMRVNTALKALNSQGMHVVVTCAAGVKLNDKNEPCLDPKLKGTGAVDTIMGSFAQILVCSKITQDTEDGEVTHHVFQFGGPAIRKEGSIMKAEGRKMVNGGVKVETFSTRVAGVPSEKLPDFMEADLGALIQFMKKN